MAKKPANKSDKITFDLRVRTVMEYILQGFNSKDILAQCTSKYGVVERMSYKYIAAAYAEFKKLTSIEIEERRAVHVAVRWKLFNELEGKKTPAGASVADGILTGIEKVQGLLVHKIEHDVKITKIKVTRK